MTTGEADRFTGALLRGRWRLGPKLAKGGQAHTFLARDEKAQGHPIVAVKEFRLGESGWKKFDLFEREARVLAKLSHPGIPRVLDQFEGDGAGCFYLVMEKAPGATLQAIATRARFSEDELVDVMAQVLAILQYLHERRPPVIHRDIKPANLLRSAEGKLSLVDFGGVAEALRDSGGSTVVGTFGYMAPEQLHGAATPATDLYGLGATIVALAGGVEPEDVPRRGLRMDLAKHLPRMSPWLVELLGRMTAPDPDHRPASASEALELLRGRRRHTPRAVPVVVPVAVGPTPPLRPAGPADPDDFDDPGMPWPLRVITRLALGAVGTVGYVALTTFELALVPLFFAILAIFAKDETKPRLAKVEGGLRGALRAGRGQFRSMQRRALGRRPRERGLPSREERPRLPPRR